jgi:DtxR family Mn-dependent transcriptional regulator
MSTQTGQRGETTEAAADYLMTIRYMHGEGQPVIAARLAERMAVSPATVSEMVNRLVRAGYLTVEDPTRRLLLTESGRVAAERTFRRHALSEWLLTEVVGLGWAEADEEAHHLQHALSDRVTDRIDELLGRPPTCPHGNPIPRDGRTPDRPAGERLSDARSGNDVTILRVTEEAEEDARLLTFLQENGVRPGHMFEVVEVAEHIGTMTLRRVGGPDDGHQVTLGLVAAAKLRMLSGRADQSLFHRPPGRARVAAAG